MSVKLIMPTFLKPVIEDKEFTEVEGKTVGECLREVYRQYPAIEKMLMDKHKLRNYIGVYINGQDAYPNEITKPVKAGDIVHILYTIAGG
jgi:molybdopterin converting factor small subunit